MVRSFTGEPVSVDALRPLCEEALRAPTAGNSAGVRLHIVSGDHVPDFFSVATDESWREQSRRYPGLSRAGAVVLVSSRPQDYEARYRAPDKAASGLGTRDAWPLPYWHGDAAMATMALLLLLEEAGLGATIWGAFRHAEEIATWAGLEEEVLYASVLLGWPDGLDERSASLTRPVPPRAERVSVVRPR